MSKKRKKKKKLTEMPLYTSAVRIDSYTAQELSQVIVDAILEVDKRKIEEKEARHTEWLQLIDSPDVHPGLHGLKRVFAYLRCIGNVFVLSFKNRDAKEGTLHIENLISAILKIIFLFAEFVIFLFSLYFTFYFVWEWQEYGAFQLPWYLYLMLFILGFTLFCLSRVFKLISDEIDKLNDMNIILGLFSSVTAFISLVIAIIAIQKG